MKSYFAGKGGGNVKKSKVITFCIILALCISFTSCIGGKTYSSAQKKCNRILDKYQAEMEELAIHALTSEEDEYGSFKEYSYCCYREQGFVKFDIDGQGMLGGQYWSLVYTDDGLLYGETEKYDFEEENGNNIIRAEKLNENWWFYWEDYDGTDKSQQ